MQSTSGQSASGIQLELGAVASLVTERAETEAQTPEATPPREFAPMLRHYLELKQQYQDHVVLYQVGDFYEIFFDDAKLASDVLNIRLTTRDKNQADAVPMCGVPIHALDGYLPRLLKAGLRCVIISQVEEPANKGAKGSSGKGMVRREISRIITPGVRFEADGLSEKQFNFLAAAMFGYRGGALAWTDVSTGDFRISEVERIEELVELLERVQPAELVLPASIGGVTIDRNEKWIREIKKLTSAGEIVFRAFEEVTPNAAEKRLRMLLSEAKRTWEFSPESALALSAALDYVTEVSCGKMPKLANCLAEVRGQVMVIDAATRRNLEMTETRIDGDEKNSLLACLDFTKTAMGGRRFRERLLNPSANRVEISQTHDAVQELCESPHVLEEIRDRLVAVRDIDRVLARVTSLRASPRDLGILRDSICELPLIIQAFANLKGQSFKRLLEDIDPLEDIHAKLHSSLSDDPPARVNDGNVFRTGASPELDEFRMLRTSSHEALAVLEAREREQTGIPSLKVRSNNVFGYYLEISKTHLQKVPDRYQRKQTLANAERFSTEELKEFEFKILSAKDRELELEKQLFSELRSTVADEAARIQRTSQALAQLDLLGSFAELARRFGYVRPEITEDMRLEITGGRHPVVERVLGEHRFVPNDARLDGNDRRFAVLTGPNMGGKSTYLRQVGLIQLLAQSGSFVPAERATLGIVDRIFTRIGAADDLARGDSTFMVEMKEAAAIVRKASAKSLVLIDEIGRGTATADGLALAQAIAEWLHRTICCRCIFATHFHELNALACAEEGMFPLSVGVVERGGEISFPHRILEEAADRSYGIEVARLAGLPQLVVDRARILLARPESPALPFTLNSGEPAPVISASAAVDPRLDEILRELGEIELDRLTPLDALLTLTRLRKILDQARGS